MYLDKPQIVFPLTKQGQPSKRYRIVAKHRYTARELLKHPKLEWAEITVRPNERLYLSQNCLLKKPQT